MSDDLTTARTARSADPAPGDAEPDPEVEAYDRSVRASLRRYRVTAYVVGCFLLALCAAMIVKYAGGNARPMSIVGPLHGFGYMIYLALAFDLSRKVGWSVKQTILVLLAGTIPFMSFVSERVVTRQIEAGQIEAGEY